MTEIRIDRLRRTYGSLVAVKDISFAFPDDKVTCLLGPSGCGKTTTLRMIGGFLHPDGGRVLIDGSDVSGLAPERRPTAMVFQNYALWPHMTVFDNVAYPLKVRKYPDVASRVEEMLSLLKLTGLGGRHPYELSGGQQQRVAIARALVYRPVVVLLDEPFSNLDIPLRLALLDEMRQLQSKIATTMIYVTHDRADALAVSDSIIVLSGGKKIASGRPTDLVRSPPNSYVAAFVAGMLVADGTIVGSEDGLTLVRTDYGEFKVERAVRKAGSVKLCIGSLEMAISQSERPNSIAGRVSGVSARPFRDAVARITTTLGTVEVEVSREEAEQLSFGMVVHLLPSPSSCLLLSE